MNENKSRKDKLADSRFKVKRILEVTNAINENEPASKLYDIFKHILLEDLEIEYAAFITRDADAWKCVVKQGLDDWDCDPELIEELLAYKDITSLGMAKQEKLRFFDMLVPVLHKGNHLGFLLLKDLEAETHAVSNLIKNLNYIQSLANIVTVAIENKRMAKAQLAQEGLKRELELAERIQKALLPNKLPNNDTIKATAYHQSYGHVGGDYYDIVKTGRSTYYFCIADISGKGVSAALLMSNFQAAFRATVRQNLTLFQIVNDLNQIVVESSQGEKFITLFLGKYESDVRELEYVNCAHPPAILFNEKMMLELKSTVPGLGMVDDFPKFDVETFTLSPGTMLTCYTDGIIEIENEAGDQYGVPRLKKSIEAFRNQPLEQFIEFIAADIEKFVGEEVANDDIAALNIQFL
ncbi:MAG: PP2C family protein-serine/threonine phosphatase [Flavobacteriales bacterium]|nr:PP2C family protein-serine/threonine phosphatase [Flavobacteriales bacterium]